MKTRRTPRLPAASRATRTDTPCCNNWICDDEDQYVLFSYAHNSCYRNHDETMPKLAADFLALTVTSPPYGNAIDCD